MKKTVLDLVNKRKNLLSEMLFMTQITSLTGTADSYDGYTGMIAKRELLLKDITAINAGLALSPLKEALLVDEKDFQEEVTLVNEASKEIADNIVKLDKNNMPTVLLIMDDIKKNLRGISAGKSVSAHYTTDAHSGNSSFDKSK